MLAYINTSDMENRVHLVAERYSLIPVKLHI